MKLPEEFDNNGFSELGSKQSLKLRTYQKNLFLDFLKH